MGSEKLQKKMWGGGDGSSPSFPALNSFHTQDKNHSQQDQPTGNQIIRYEIS
jgi:hypothetical protein